MLILSNPLLFLLLWTPNVIRLPSLEAGDEGVMGPPGAESVWSWVSSSLGRPLNLVHAFKFQDICVFVKYFKG
jgi:hypothetical protein